MQTMKTNFSQRKREAGAALLLAVLLVVLIGMIGIFAMQTASMNSQLSGNQIRKASSVYAADAAVSHAMSMIRGLGSAGASALAVNPTTGCITNSKNNVKPKDGKFGDSASYVAGLQPTYGLDSDVCYIGDTPEPCESEMSMEVGSVPLRRALWVINATGTTAGMEPGGIQSRITAIVSICGAY